MDSGRIIGYLVLNYFGYVQIAINRKIEIITTLCITLLLVVSLGSLALLTFLQFPVKVKKLLPNMQ